MKKKPVRCYCLILFLLIVTSSLISTYFFENWIVQLRRLNQKLQLFEYSWVSRMEPLGNVPNDTKIIMFYTAWFGRMPWPGVRDEKTGLTDRGGQLCPVSSCRVSNFRGDFSRSHAVVFHGGEYDMPVRTNLLQIVSKKPKHQKWVWLLQENPEKLEYNPALLNNAIDMTVTYAANADFPLPYGSYASLTKVQMQSSSSKDTKNYAQGKDRLIVWIASNCDPVLRLKIVRRISQFIQVDVYGSCSKLFYRNKRFCTWGSPTCTSIKKRYKFYLSLENYNCKDYVTEKYWKNALENELVPVVVAGAYNKNTLIPGSYIDVLDFPNAKDLADYLLFLDGNDTAYNEYFEWKRKFKVVYQPTDSWLCKLCEMLHRNDSARTLPIKDFGKYWGAKENCHANDSYINSVWLTSNTYWLKFSQIHSLISLTVSVFQLI